MRKKIRKKKAPSHLRRFYRLSDLKQILNVSGSSIWAWSKLGKFPKSIKLSANVTVWDAHEVDNWCSDRAAANKGAS